MKEKKVKFTESRFFKLTVAFFAQIREDNISAYAASCAFFFFLSLVPMIIVLLTILPFTPIKEADLITIIGSKMPTTLGNLLISLIAEAYNRSLGVLSIAIIMTIWSAGKGVNALIDGLNAIEHVKDKRNSLLMRLFASLYTLIFLASIVIFLLLIVYGKLAKNFLIGNFPKLSVIFNKLIYFRSGITIILMTVVFMVLYAVLPYGKRKIRIQFLGAFLAAFLWMAFSFVFSWYVDNFGAFSMYGSLTTIMILCFWLYFCMFFVFIGANINRYFRPIMLVIDKKFAQRSEVRYQPESLDD